MIRRNILHMLRFAPGVSFLLLLSMATIICVIISASGMIISLNHFFADYRNVRYIVDIEENTMSKGLLSLCDTDGDERIFAISTADQDSCSVIVGIGGGDGWMPPNDVELLSPNNEEFLNISSLRKKAYIDSHFYNLYENIDPWIDEVTISGKVFAANGMGNYYFSGNEYDSVISRSENNAVETSLFHGDLALYDPANGEKYVYPNRLGTIMISLSDFVELNIPTAYLSFVFQTPPSFEQYQMVKDKLGQIDGQIEAYRTGSRDFNLSHINAVIYLTALSVALLLVRFLIKFLLDACQAIWRGLFIIGCQPNKILIIIMVQFLCIYSAAAVLAFLPCRLLINWLAGMNVSISISLGMQVFLTIGCIILLLIASLPVILSALRNYTREDGGYVPSY